MCCVNSLGDFFIYHQFEKIWNDRFCECAVLCSVVLFCVVFDVMCRVVCRCFVAIHSHSVFYLPFCSPRLLCCAVCHVVLFYAMICSVFCFTAICCVSCFFVQCGYLMCCVSCVMLYLNLQCVVLCCVLFCAKCSVL